jgi:hypothetical protein
MHSEYIQYFSLYFQLKLSSKSCANSTVNKSKNSPTTISNGTVVSTPNDGNLVIQGKHRLSNEVNLI